MYSELEFQTTSSIDPATLIQAEITRDERASQNLGMTAKNHKRHIAQHRYRDFSYVRVDINRLDEKRKAKGGVTDPFPIKLHQILDQIENDGLSSIISWQPHGRAFVVHNQNEFIKSILPTYFNQSKLRSFQRQLNRYGFSRLFSGRDKGGYYHELFLRGKPFLSDHMMRAKVKGTEVRGLSSPETEPDFYSMPHVVPDCLAVQVMRVQDLSNHSEQTPDPFLSQSRSQHDQSLTQSSIDSILIPGGVGIMQANLSSEDFILEQAQTSEDISMNLSIASCTFPADGTKSNELSTLFALCSGNSTDDHSCKYGDFEKFLPFLFDSFENENDSIEVRNENARQCDELFSRINDVVPDNDPDFCHLLDQLS